MKLESLILYQRDYYLKKNLVHDDQILNSVYYQLIKMNAEKNDIDFFIDWNNQLLCEKNLGQYLQQVNQFHDSLKNFFDNIQEKIDGNISKYLQVPYSNFNDSGNFVGDSYQIAFTLEKYRGSSQHFISDHCQILKICKVFVVLNQFFEKNLKPGKSQLKFYRIFMVLKTRLQLYEDEDERFQIEENELESNGQDEKQEKQNEIENSSKENEKNEEKKEGESNSQINSEDDENQIKSEEKIEDKQIDEKNEEEKQNEDEDEYEEFGNIQQPKLSKMFTVDPQYKARKEELEQQQQLQIQKQNEKKEKKEIEDEDEEDEKFSQIQEDLKMRKRFSSIYQRNQIDFLKLQYIMETELSELIDYVIQQGNTVFWKKYKRTQEAKFSGEKKDIQKILKQEIKSYSKKQKKQKDIWSLDFQIDRNNIFQSSISSLIYLYPSSYISGHLDIRFEYEEGIDAGGLQREWFNLFFKEAFDPKFGLFQVSANKVTVQPSPLAKVVPNYQLYFRIIGRLVGKVIYDKMEVEVNFTRSFLKHILRKDLYITDLEDIDPEQFNNLNWMLENSVEGLELNYTHCVDELGVIKTVDLVEKGSEIEITDENKKEYVKDIAHYIMTESIKEQTESFIQGFYEIVPISALKEVSEQQLGLILSGHQNIDVDDMEKHAIYQSGYTENSDIIKWLWQILRYDWNEDQKSQFLFFVTGGFKVPHGGFKEYQIEFYKEDNPNQLPVAHTCSRGLDLPAYSSKEILKEKLEIAIYEGAKGFHIS
ncbi:HECT-domain-containing protein [Pseudocohnilembus persalinus]|uniref:HECT-type E3 ubiquitin transferase n=1 Tax=Pseudocohnilembus persalinus TaxID=266149 RepID=A0A0V0R9B0_PSEPJ|nr:HECT-domain-containing protein [Pseudocohnilembus persalinus]|eukprot:KRX10837.1 HECT-domain-containing protein [Pseudocohnilembus persalinus]